MKLAIPQETLLTVAQVARLLNISKSNVYNLLNAGTLDYIAIGKSKRVDPEALQACIEANKQDWRVQ